MSQARFRVVVTDYPFPNVDIERRELARIGAELVAAQCKAEEEVLELTRNADGVLNCYAKITRRVIDAMSRCRIIARYGIGVDNVDVGAATNKGIIVTNVPDYCIDEVSDHALALLLALERKVPQLNATVKAGMWRYVQYRPIFRLRGKTLGLVGFGRIARRLAEKALAIGLQVQAYDPYAGEDQLEKLHVKRSSLAVLVATSDYVSIHCPLTAETRNMFNERLIGKMKPTAYLINTARGGIVDEEALYHALVEKRIAGAALDVLANECEPVESPLKELENVILTPHAAYFSEEAMAEQQLKAVMQVVKVLQGEKPDYPVNL